MTEAEIIELQGYAREVCPKIQAVMMNPSDAVFEECVKMNCYYCGRYGTNWRCPPKIPNINYQKMFSEYDYGMFLVVSYDVENPELYQELRNESSVKLHRTLLACEKWLWNRDYPTAISFGGGSCKLCKGGCGKERCNNPYLARSPLEALGVNVIKTARKYGIQIHFPTERHFVRLGLVMWQD